MLSILAAEERRDRKMIFTSASLKTLSRCNTWPRYLGCGERYDRKVIFTPEEPGDLLSFQRISKIAQHLGKNNKSPIPERFLRDQ